MQSYSPFKPVICLEGVVQASFLFPAWLQKPNGLSVLHIRHARFQDNRQGQLSNHNQLLRDNEVTVQ